MRRFGCIARRIGKQREGLVTHVIAERLTDHTALLTDLYGPSDATIFDDAVAPADGVCNPTRAAKITIPMSRDFR